MVRRSLSVFVAVTVASLVCLVWCSPSDSLAAGKSKRPLKKRQVDPNAAQIELFEGIAAGKLDVKVVPKSALGGNVLIENNSDEPLTVKLPEAVIAVPKHLAQFGGLGGGGFGGGGLGGGGLGGGGLGGGLGGGGGQQSLGGGLGGGGLGGGTQYGGGGQQGGGGFFGGGGGGAFSIPPEQVASIPLTSVCLEHGKPEPGVRSEYVLLPVEKLSDNPVLFELLKLVGTGRVDLQAAQAAAWNIANNMSWEQLANKSMPQLNGLPPKPYFTQNQLLAGQALLAQARKAAEDAPARPKTETHATRVAEPAAASAK